MLEYTKLDNGKLCIRISKGVYSLKAIFRASYIFTDQYYIGIDETDQEYIVYLTSKNKDISDEVVAGEFQNELLHQSIRTAVEAETKQIRELIVTRALYSAFIPEEIQLTANDDGKTHEYNLDDIAKAWYNENSDAE